MNRLALAHPKIRRLAFSRQALFVGLAICFVWFVTVSMRNDVSEHWSRLGLQLPDLRKQPQRMPTHNVLPPLAPRIPCYGPRGHLLGHSPDDDLVEKEIDGPYPIPFAGSFEALGFDLTYMTAENRYGPYGYGEDKQDYKRQKVDWANLDWGKLQNECFYRNRERFPEAAEPLNDTRIETRFTYRKNAPFSEIRHWHEFEPSRRTAIVVRVWKGYEYSSEDMYYIRSLIAETSLKSGGEYQVILLVDMKDYEGYKPEIFASRELYEQGLKDAGVPPEFASIAILWDNRLLDSWYPDVEEHRTMWQVFQPMQLLALFYPEFDHWWQVEMDMRFMGDAGKMLDRLALFAREEPRKQALERATFWHMINEIGDYEEFSKQVDKANNGGSLAWGPMRVREILPIGPEPPVSDPRNETFHWGVGEEADVITTSYCNDANKPNSWVFKEWIYGFKKGVQTPRYYCPPAIMRGSRTLLLAIHQAQVEQGIRVPSEATLPSFALWHGLKLSFPQHPVFHRDNGDDKMQDEWWRGGPRASKSGNGPDNLDHPRGMGLTFWWESDFPRQIFSAWTGRKLEEGVDFPWLLHQQDGQIFAPNIIMHPMKHIKDDQE
ncbi:hypothetical protein QC761_501780 [Podospora bellae-mahoneyi]|uniref:Glycosyltransferase Family 34 n=1 Tax=Podospora bellae-mahoneyi TaxID=2093777 RepID=A0ABR0FFC7_9PEZI|nr:hypothetical protein QC761_501780 [Podospora bellae-mahoneyi]